MAMERYSILVGNCYLDRYGAVHKVKSIDPNDQVSLVTYQRTAEGGASAMTQTLPLAKLLPDLQGQVACPKQH